MRAAGGRGRLATEVEINVRLARVVTEFAEGQHTADHVEDNAAQRIAADYGKLPTAPELRTSERTNTAPINI